MIHADGKYCSFCWNMAGAECRRDEPVRRYEPLRERGIITGQQANEAYWANELTCAECRQVFRWFHPNKQYCSNECQAIATRRFYEESLRDVRCRTCGVVFHAHPMRQKCDACKERRKAKPAPPPVTDRASTVHAQVAATLRQLALERRAARSIPDPTPVPVTLMRDVPRGGFHLLESETQKRANGMLAMAPWSWLRKRRTRRYEGFR